MREFDTTSHINGMTTNFIIEKTRDLDAYNVDKKTNSSIKDIVIGRTHPEGSVSYYNISNLSRTSAVKLGLRTEEGVKDIEVPQPILSRIADYHREFPAKSGIFDCVSFVHYVNNVPFALRRFNFDNWQSSGIDRIENLSPGATIMMLDILSHGGEFGIRPIHFAIYLTDGLFISKFGSIGPLVVADYDQMKKNFGGDEVVQIKPRQIQDDLVYYNGFAKTH